MKPPGWKSAIPGAAVGFFFSNSQFIYTFYKFCANNFTIPVQTGAYNISEFKILIKFCMNENSGISETVNPSEKFFYFF